MITVADAMKVMTAVAVCHHRTAPRMDDAEVVRVTAQIWANMFNAQKLALTDLLAAVEKRAGEGHHEAPEPGEIIAFARVIRSERASRESRAEREARENAWDQKLLEANQRRLARELRGFGKQVPELEAGEAESA